jgi:hypothetical protein
MKRKVGLVLGVSMIGMIAARPLYIQPPIHFDNLQEAASTIRKLNYTCCSDRSDGKIQSVLVSGFMVSKELATWVQAGELCKIGPMGPNWVNKVWVIRLPTAEMPVIPDNSGTRVWGRVFAFGDPAFLDEIENGLRECRAFSL